MNVNVLAACSIRSRLILTGLRIDDGGERRLRPVLSELLKPHVSVLAEIPVIPTDISVDVEQKDELQACLLEGVEHS